MPVTIKDIAKAAGVSHTTVSRALKDNPAISARTTKRIKKLARDMGYMPSAVAQSLLAQRTRTIGMVVTSIADPYITRVVEGVESAAQSARYSVFLATSNNNPEQEVQVVETFHRRRVDAVIVSSSRVGSLYSLELDRIRVPIVLINNQEEGTYLYSVAIDDEQGAKLATEHLLALGHQRIAYIGTPHRPKSNRQRTAGYRLALYQAGIAANPELEQLPPVRGYFERGQYALDAILAGGATAVFCYNDITAIGLLSACHQRGVHVPAALSIVGFDDIESALYVQPTLTTIHQPRLDLGKAAMSMALDLLGNNKVQNRLLPVNLIVRQSTAAI